MASPGHTGRRRNVPDHTLNTQTLSKTDEQRNILSKCTVSYWAAFIAILGHMQPLGRRLDPPGRSFLGTWVLCGAQDCGLSKFRARLQRKTLGRVTCRQVQRVACRCSFMRSQVLGLLRLHVPGRKRPPRPCPAQQQLRNASQKCSFSAPPCQDFGTTRLVREAVL